MITVLLDTNALIALEDTDRFLLEQHAEMLKAASDSVEFYIHPAELEDIEQDPNSRRKELLRSRIRKYKEITKPPKVNMERYRSLGWSTEKRNDLVDNQLLLCIVDPVVDYLVTNDEGMIRKARKAGVVQKALRLNELCDLLNVKSEPSDLACVQDEPCHILDIQSPFFDSLKEDYGEETFTKWFINKCARKQRRCWSIYLEGELRALCIYKPEDSQIIDDAGFKPSGQLLKLCTFKVDQLYQGTKAGERLLHAAFNYARCHDVDFIYFTVKEKKHAHLVDLANQFGFLSYGKNSDGDRVIGKYLKPQNEQDRNLEKFQFVRRFYPSFKEDESVGKYLVPIQSQYHERLFPDIADFKNSLFGNDASMYSSESNTIRKAYLCGSSIKRIEPGDLLLFYRSRDKREISTLGVVTEIHRLFDSQRIFEIVKRRTVYSLGEIEELVERHAGGVLVVCFDFIGPIKRPFPQSEFASIGLSVPISIRSITDAQYRTIVGADK